MLFARRKLGATKYKSGKPCEYRQACQVFNTLNMQHAISVGLNEDEEGEERGAGAAIQCPLSKHRVLHRSRPHWEPLKQVENFSTSDKGPDATNLQLAGLLKVLITARSIK